MLTEPRRKLYHLRILALGIVPLLVLAAAIPFGLWATCCLGRLVELWARRHD